MAKITVERALGSASVDVDPVYGGAGIAGIGMTCSMRVRGARVLLDASDVLVRVPLYGEDEVVLMSAKAHRALLGGNVFVRTWRALRGVGA